MGGRQYSSPCRRCWSGSKDQRFGFSLLELLVVIGIVGLLMAILIPAVQGVRESSRKLQCADHLRQISVAISGYESAHQHLPKTGQYEGNYWQGMTSYHAALLPWLERNDLAQKLENIRDGSYLSEMPPPGEDPFWEPVVRELVPVFLCPSDPTPFGNNYRFCAASIDLRGADGPFGRKADGSPWKIRDMTRGTSNTAAVSEKVKSPVETVWNPKADFWFTGLWNGDGPVPEGDELYQLCGTLAGSAVSYQTYTGHSWLPNWLTFTEYNHVGTPNPGVPDCSIEGGGPSDWTYPCALGTGVRSATSYHTGGVQLLFLDGHVSFVSSSIDRNIWRQIATRTEPPPAGRQ